MHHKTHHWDLLCQHPHIPNSQILTSMEKMGNWVGCTVKSTCRTQIWFAGPEVIVLCLFLESSIQPIVEFRFAMAVA
jgi:hypothetical protein